jgi:hypothetical protein
VSFAAITLCVASQRVFIVVVVVVVVVVYFVMTQSGNFWIHPRTYISRAKSRENVQLSLRSVVHIITSMLPIVLKTTCAYFRDVNLQSTGLLRPTTPLRTA